MVILGLGSNIGDRLANLRKSVTALQSLAQLNIKQVSPVYMSDALMPENAPADWNMPYLNLAVLCETTLGELELLDALKNIEWSIGRKPAVRHWGPRIIDIDILAWDDRIIQNDRLTVPHASLQERPFALWPLADVAPLWRFPLAGAHHGKTAAQLVEVWGSRFSGDAPFHTKQINQRVDTSQLVGILNITPDSFSDGGLFIQPEIALQQYIHLAESGADIIDIGAESTAPSAKPLNHVEEWARLEPVLSLLLSKQKELSIAPKISVDTRHPETAKKSLELGVDWINDVSGLDNPAMREIIAASQVDCVVMHHLSIPENRNHLLPRDQDPTPIVLEWGEKRLRELEIAGISRDRMIFDPGIGFGKMAEQSLILMQNISVFKQLGVRILVGHSRKTFISLLSSLPFAERDVETLALSLHLMKQSVDYIRVHNVSVCARGMKVAKVMG